MSDLAKLRAETDRERYLDYSIEDALAAERAAADQDTACLRVDLQSLREQRDAAQAALRAAGIPHMDGDGYPLAEQVSALAEQRDQARAEVEERDAEIARLRAALWGFDYNPGGKPGARGYFCAGCDLEDAERDTSPFHDDDCQAARSALDAPPCA